MLKRVETSVRQKIGTELTNSEVRKRRKSVEFVIDNMREDKEAVIRGY